MESPNRIQLSKRKHVLHLYRECAHCTRTADTGCPSPSPSRSRRMCCENITVFLRERLFLSTVAIHDLSFRARGALACCALEYFPCDTSQSVFCWNATLPKCYPVSVHISLFFVAIWGLSSFNLDEKSSVYSWLPMKNSIFEIIAKFCF